MHEPAIHKNYHTSSNKLHTVSLGNKGKKPDCTILASYCVIVPALLTTHSPVHFLPFCFVFWQKYFLNNLVRFSASKGEKMDTAGTAETGYSFL